MGGTAGAGGNGGYGSGGGGGGGGGGGVHLSTAQVKQVTAQVQAALLRQAKTNRRTGITLPGYGS